MSQRNLPPATDATSDRRPGTGVSRRALFAATAVGVPAATAVLAAAPAVADPAVTDGETRVVDVPLAEAALVDADGIQVRDLPKQPATMVGVTWPQDSDAPTVSARGLADDGNWTLWCELETAEDPETGDSAAGTELAWLGVVSALQIRAELDGGDVSADLTAHVLTTSSAADDDRVERLSGPSSTQSQSQQMTMRAAAPAANPATPTLGPGMPAFVTRASWGADERKVRGTSAANQLKAVVIHHTAGTNNYTSSQSAQIMRGILSYHTGTLGWADIGYNILVDKYGRIFEGRSGGLHRNIIGAHAYGFNTGSFGISVMGDYSSRSVSTAARTAVGKLVAWKLLSTFQTSVWAKSSWTPGTGTRFTPGKTISLAKMMGHRDVNYTECPGKTLYGQFDTIRGEAQRFLDSGWKEHLWAFKGAGGASKLGTVVKSAHTTGKYRATVLTKGLVLQEGKGSATGYVTESAARWRASWGRPVRSPAKDGSRRIQAFENGTVAIESGKTRFVEPSFRDVRPERVFFLEIQDLRAREITTGWGDGTFRPNSNNLRDAMIVFIYRAMGSPKYTAPARSRFVDVDPSFVFYKEICWGYDKGIARGWADGRFRPLESVKRDAVAAFLYRAAKSPAASASDTDPFTDVSRKHIFAKEIGWLAKTGISRGWDDGTFRPNAYIKRDQMATFVMRWMTQTGKS